jgi:hypothetical protein
MKYDYAQAFRDEWERSEFVNTRCTCACSDGLRRDHAHGCAVAEAEREVWRRVTRAAMKEEV